MIIAVIDMNFDEGKLLPCHVVQRLEVYGAASDVGTKYDSGNLFQKKEKQFKNVHISSKRKAECTS